MTITNKEDLREVYGEPSERAQKKDIGYLDRHCRNFIAASPFCVLSSAGADGRADSSPKGDRPGFVAVLDDHTLLIPDRPGNNRVDSMRNILDNPHVGLLFFVPGVNETLRVNGRASITTDGTLLAPLAVKGKTPRVGVIVEAQEVYLHCAKALIRSNLWNPEGHVQRGRFPTLGRMLADQIEGLEHSPETEKADQEKLRNSLY